MFGDVITGLKNQDALAQPLQGQLSNKAYQPHQSPADLNMAKDHGLAKKVYMLRVQDKNSEEDNVKRCPCCDLPVGGELIPLCTDLKGLYHLGSGYALYFRFLKFAIVILLLMFLAGGIFNVMTNKNNTTACIDTSNKSDYCIPDFITKYSIANKRDDPNNLHYQQYFNLLTIIIIIVFFHYVRYELRRTEIEVDDDTVTPADYTSKVSGVPIDTTDEELKTWLESFSTVEKPIKVVKITRSKNLLDYMRITASIDDIVNKRCKTDDQDKIMVFNDQIKTAYQDLKKLKNGHLENTKITFVTFEKAYHNVDIIDIFKRNKSAHKKQLFHCFYPMTANMLKGSRVRVSRAPEPSDIMWANLSYSKGTKHLRRIYTYILTVLMVVGSFVMIVAVSFAQKAIIKHLSENSVLVQILAFMSSLVIMIVNFYLGQFLRRLAEYEKHGTYTSFFKGIAEKLAVAQLINTAFTTLVAKVVVTIFLTDIGDESELSAFGFYSKGGLIEGMFYVFISNAYCTPILNIFDFFYAMKLYSRRKAEKDPYDRGLNQKAAHTLFEGTQYDMSYKYAMLMKTILLTCFFAPAIPIALIISVLGLSAMYWVDKYLLLRRAALPSALGGELTRSMIEYIEWAGFMYAAGNAFFYYTLQDLSGNQATESSPVIVWAGVILSLINIYLPMGYINKMLFEIVDDVSEEDVYDFARLGFYTDYDIANPVTRKQGQRDLKEAFDRHQASVSPSKVTKMMANKFQDRKKNIRGETFMQILDGVVADGDESGELNLGVLNNVVQGINHDDEIAEQKARKPTMSLLQSAMISSHQAPSNAQPVTHPSAEPTAQATNTKTVINPFTGLPSAQSTQPVVSPFGTQQMNAQPITSPFGGQPMTSPFGGQPMMSPFGGQPIMSPFGGQPVMSPFGGQPIMSPFGGQPMTSPFGGQPMMSPFGGQPIMSPFGGQPMMSPFGGPQQVMNPFGGAQPGHNPLLLSNGAQPITSSFPIFNGAQPTSSPYSIFNNNQSQENQNSPNRSSHSSPDKDNENPSS